MLPLRLVADLLPGIVASELRAYEKREVRSWQCRHTTESGCQGVLPRASEANRREHWCAHSLAASRKPAGQRAAAAPATRTCHKSGGNAHPIMIIRQSNALPS